MIKYAPLRPRATTSNSSLSVSSLSKTFNGLRAVDSLSLEVEHGEIYGFLGPNGAGKTTTIKMVLGLTYPDAGEVLIDGLDLSQRPHEIKRRIGFLPERLAFYDNLTALQTLEFYASLKGHTKDGLSELLESVGLRQFADKKVGTYSKGMIQLLGVAQALMGSPSLLLLDEPTTGLDPNWTRVVKDRILQANQEGATVFFSSHILTEVQELAGRVGILNKGKLLAEDTVSNLGSRLEIKPRLHITVTGELEAAAGVLRDVDGVDEARASGGELLVTLDARAKTKVLSRLEERGVTVQDFRTEEPSLEEVFLKFTEDVRREIR
ncbi:MAG: ATP-binding cassette domain-containing protein [Thermoplasmata archaeon]